MKQLLIFETIIVVVYDVKMMHDIWSYIRACTSWNFKSLSSKIETEKKLNLKNTGARVCWNYYVLYICILTVVICWLGNTTAF